MWTGLFHEVSLCKTHAFGVRGATFGAKILALSCSKHKNQYRLMLYGELFTLYHLDDVPLPGVLR